MTADTADTVELVQDQEVGETAEPEQVQTDDAGQPRILCPEPGCGKDFENSLHLGAHRRIHGYVSANPKKSKKSTKAVVPATVKALDEVLEATRARLLEVLGGGTEVGRLTTENIALRSQLRQALVAVTKADRRRDEAVDKLKHKTEALAARVQDAESQWFQDEKVLEEIVHILSTHAPLAAVAAITGVLPARLLPAES